LQEQLYICVLAATAGGASVKGEEIARASFPWPTKAILWATIKRSLRVGICVRYNYYIQLVAIWRARVLKRNNIFLEGGWKLVVHITVYGVDITD